MQNGSKAKVTILNEMLFYKLDCILISLGGDSKSTSLLRDTDTRWRTILIFVNFGLFCSIFKKIWSYWITWSVKKHKDWFSRAPFALLYLEKFAQISCTTPMWTAGKLMVAKITLKLHWLKSISEEQILLFIFLKWIFSLGLF